MFHVSPTRGKPGIHSTSVQSGVRRRTFAHFFTVLLPDPEPFESSGFLPHEDPLERSGVAEMAAVEAACSELTGLLRAGDSSATRKRISAAALAACEMGAVAAISELSDASPLGARELRRCLLALSILCNAYAWCGGAGDVVTSLPDTLSRLLVVAARGVGAAPILTHCSIVLSNFRRINKKVEDLSTTNLEMVSGFLHSPDEAFFCEWLLRARSGFRCHSFSQLLL